MASRLLTWELRNLPCRIVHRMASSSSSSSLIAIVQLACSSDKAANRSRAHEWIRRAKAAGARAVFLPEAFDYIGESVEQTLELSEPLEGDTISSYRSLAASEGIVVSLGGFHRRLDEGGASRLSNTHVLIGPDGDILATYAKAHLFDVNISGGPRLKESDYVKPGEKIGQPVATSVGKIGLGVCYDLRFPEFSLALVRAGAQILTFPSAFTVSTGMAHWETLLRARAIETQCYVVAAAQTGKHNAKRSSYGHSLVADPWGTVVAQCGEGEGMALAQIKMDYLNSVRSSMPTWSHRRGDLYGLAVSGEHSAVQDDQDGHFHFGPVNIPASCVVFVSRLSYVCVNRKPVLPGHLLVVPKRSDVPRLADLTAEEVADLFLAVQRAQKVTEVHFSCSASTVSVQDGAAAGRTIEHVHVHVLPRSEGDFANNDDIYEELAKHDKGNDVKWRSQDEMVQEAAAMRQTADKLM